jgi:hypothetical protein
MGLRDETVQWLFPGKTQQWKDTKDEIATADNAMFVCEGRSEWTAQFVKIPNDCHSYVTH